jgi:hypothetical protein
MRLINKKHSVQKSADNKLLQIITYIYNKNSQCLHLKLNNNISIISFTLLLAFLLYIRCGAHSVITIK